MGGITIEMIRIIKIPTTKKRQKEQMCHNLVQRNKMEVDVVVAVKLTLMSNCGKVAVSKELSYKRIVQRGVSPI